MKLTGIRNVLILDAAILLVVGGALIFMPRKAAEFFHFTDLPGSMNYLLALWGCVLVTLGAAYAIASTNPLRHRLWIQIGIARGVIETLLGIFYLATGAASLAQAGFGTVAAALMAASYALFYPRTPTKAPVARVQT
jgi:hypothetical protein